MNLNQVTVPALDIPQSIAFYQALGLRLIVESEHYARFECPEGDATFSLHLEERAGLSSTLVYFEVKDLAGTVAGLKALGLEFSKEPTEEPWLWRESRLHDPAGNQICIYTAGVNRKHPPWRVSGDKN
jgi:catechol 2,3-dioxygenase-like lactoylglutathione lyase family enzyme